MNKNKEIHDGKERIVEYDIIEHPVTHKHVELPISITDVDTGDIEDIIYSNDDDKLKKTKTKREKHTLDDIWKKLSDIEHNIELITSKTKR